MGGNFIPREEGSMPVAQSGRGGGGVRWNVTRKYFAVTGANEMVCDGASLLESFATGLKLHPSSLASRVLSGAAIPATKASIQPGSFVTYVMARIVCG